jgi:ornithine carbamoyltransferase
MAQHLLAIDDVSEDFLDIINWGIEFKKLWKSGDEIAMNFMPLDTMSIGSIYEKPSTRTRISFEVGINRLGGYPLTLLKNDIQLGTSETVGDTAMVLSRFLDGITYRCFGHADVVELAENSDVPVINALSDKHHPCQAAADLMTVLEHFPERAGLKVAWVGDGNNVLHDLMLACAILGIDCHYAIPKGYEPDNDIVSRAENFAQKNGSEMIATNDPAQAVAGANVIYTDVFISMGEENLKNKINDFDGFQINMELLSGANKNWAFMHCLPAHRGDEVTDEVMDHTQSIVFDQAENRMWAQMSLLAYLISPDAWGAMGDMMGIGL